MTGCPSVGSVDVLLSSSLGSCVLGERLERRELFHPKGPEAHVISLLATAEVHFDDLA